VEFENRLEFDVSRFAGDEQAESIKTATRAITPGGHLFPIVIFDIGLVLIFIEKPAVRKNPVL